MPKGKKQSLISSYCDGKKIKDHEPCQYYTPGVIQYNSECHLINNSTFFDLLDKCRFDIPQYISNKLWEKIKNDRNLFRNALKHGNIEYDIEDLRSNIYIYLQEHPYERNCNIAMLISTIDSQIGYKIRDYRRYIYAISNQEPRYPTKGEISNDINKITSSNLANKKEEEIIKLFHKKLVKRANNEKQKLAKNKFKKQIPIFLRLMKLIIVDEYTKSEAREELLRIIEHSERTRNNYWKEYSDLLYSFLKEYCGEDYFNNLFESMNEDSDEN